MSVRRLPVTGQISERLTRELFRPEGRPALSLRMIPKSLSRT
jgi:hypothetical protein